MKKREEQSLEEDKIEEINLSLSREEEKIFPRLSKIRRLEEESKIPESRRSEDRRSKDMNSQKIEMKG
jgi:hypothetical protein